MSTAYKNLDFALGEDIDLDRERGRTLRRLGQRRKIATRHAAQGVATRAADGAPRLVNVSVSTPFSSLAADSA